MFCYIHFENDINIASSCARSTGWPPWPGGEHPCQDLREREGTLPLATLNFLAAWRRHHIAQVPSAANTCSLLLAMDRRTFNRVASSLARVLQAPSSSPLEARQAPPSRDVVVVAILGQQRRLRQRLSQPVSRIEDLPEVVWRPWEWRVWIL